MTDDREDVDLQVVPDADAPDYSVHVSEAAGGWVVSITGRDGSALLRRPCADQAEARTFASTVRQHLYWLSAEKFRDYYRLQES